MTGIHAPLASGAVIDNLNESIVKLLHKSKDGAWRKNSQLRFVSFGFVRHRIYRNLGKRLWLPI
jgi:hypothetical protein